MEGGLQALECETKEQNRAYGNQVVVIVWLLRPHLQQEGAAPNKADALLITTAFRKWPFYAEIHPATGKLTGHMY